MVKGLSVSGWLWINMQKFLRFWVPVCVYQMKFSVVFILSLIYNDNDDGDDDDDNKLK